MKRVVINTGKVGLVYKNGDYKRMLTAGKHWLKPFESVVVYDMAQAFMPGQNLSIYLQDKQLRNVLNLVNVADHEITVQFEDGQFSSVLRPGRYAFWKGLVDYTFIKVDLTKVEIDEPINKEVLAKSLLAVYVRTFSIQSYEKGLLFIDGKFEKVLEKGEYRFWKNSIPIVVLKADMRQLQM